MIDIAIVGGGPAGLSAAVNAAARNRSAIIFSNKRETGALYKAEAVNNHLGMPQMSGAELIKGFYEHTEQLGIEVKIGRVMQILSMGDYFTINFENNFYEARTVIIATGIAKSGGIEGETEYLGRGVSYCATCDAMLYRNKKTIVVGETDEGVPDANFLAEVCSHVTYISKNAPENINESVDFIKGYPTKVVGGEFVTGVLINGEEIPCDGIFFSKTVVPPDMLIYGLEISDYIVVNRRMETNLKGVFACGDCTGWPYQLSKAIGEGLVAAQQADRFL